MSTLNKTFLFASLILMGGLHFSCKKLQDELNHNPNLKKSKIASITFALDDDGYSDIGNYDKTTYFNAQGEPIKTIAANPTTGNSHQTFIYDKKGRLSKFVLYFGDEPAPNTMPLYYNVFFVHSYSHDNNGNIVTDTSINFNGQSGKGQLYGITNYKYDGYGRMTQSYWHSKFGTEYDVLKNYQYDVNGNAKGYSYDDKPNFCSLSKVMAFLNRNYSLNNAIKTDPFVEGDPICSYTYGKYKLASSARRNKLIPDENPDMIGNHSIQYTY